MKLAREDWDFREIEPEHLTIAWGFEYGRHVEWVREAYRRVDTFDGAGNWQYIYDVDGEGDQISFRFPHGFPMVSFAEAVKVARFPKPEIAEWLAQPLARHSLSVRAMSQLSSNRPGNLMLEMNWKKSDQELLADFKKVLKEKRPSPPIEQRGHSEVTRSLGDLKALGAWRLLEIGGMTAEEAIDHTSRVLKKKNGLFAHGPDWYVARKRALRVFSERFNCPNPLVGTGKFCSL